SIAHCHRGNLNLFNNQKLMMMDAGMMMFMLVTLPGAESWACLQNPRGLNPVISPKCLVDMQKKIWHMRKDMYWNGKEQFFRIAYGTSKWINVYRKKEEQGYFSTCLKNE
ncbi:hypothetical protein ACJX0J_041747, partial [Zea mays]